MTEPQDPTGGSAQLPVQHPYRHLWAAIDALIWVAAVCLVTWLRYDLVWGQTTGWGVVCAGGVAGLLHLVLGYMTGPYRIAFMRASFEEAWQLARTAGMSTGLFFLPLIVSRPPLVPRSTPIVAGCMALTGMLGLRFALRVWRLRHWRSRPGERPVIIFGAGDGGRLIIRAMQRDRTKTFHPVAILDDSSENARLNIDGVRVRGTREDIARVAATYGASTLVIAIPSASGELLRDLKARAEEAGLSVLTMPATGEMLGTPSTSDLRDLNLSDLLGRRPVALDDTAISAAINGKRVLVTGAGGSIGSELCRQLSRFVPSRLYMVDRDESGLLATKLSVSGQGLLDSDDVILIDIRDKEALESAFDKARPDIVFHAAALKHLPLLERFPLESWKSNVLGTNNVLSTANRHGVEIFVNISTDKAADPINVLGYSKRIAERITAAYAARGAGKYVSVRFGNVLGSRGSVIPTFLEQIDRGGPVTVTHPEAERFFMLIPEACQLTLEAAVLGVNGEVMVLDMGEPVRILDVAKTLISLCERPDVEVKFTGLRPGEKLSEDLFSLGEDYRATENPLVTCVDVPALDPQILEAQQFHSDEEVIAWYLQEARKNS